MMSLFCRRLAPELARNCRVLSKKVFDYSKAYPKSNRCFKLSASRFYSSQIDVKKLYKYNFSENSTCVEIRELFDQARENDIKLCFSGFSLLSSLNDSFSESWKEIVDVACCEVAPNTCVLSISVRVKENGVEKSMVFVGKVTKVTRTLDTFSDYISIGDMNLCQHRHLLTLTIVLEKQDGDFFKLNFCGGQTVTNN